MFPWLERTLALTTKSVYVPGMLEKVMLAAPPEPTVVVAIAV